MEYYSKKEEEVFGIFSTHENGLTSGEAHDRLGRFGPNVLPEPQRESVFLIFLRQFASPLIYVLFLAAAVVFWLGEFTDGLVIIFVLILNAAIGAFQEGKATNTLRALKKFVETNATVFRDGEEEIIPDREVVPGDIILLQEGEKVPADARLFLSRGLLVDEAALTGESEPASKEVGVVFGENVSVADQNNMVFRGTYVVVGNGKAVVIRTGAETFIGAISKEITSITSDIPLKKDIKELSKMIVGVVFLISASVFLLGVYFEKTASEMFRTVVALAVSAIPEGLPVVFTVVLAAGVFRMSRKKALVKKLQAVEALGQVTVIAVDKTGTLTKNELVLRDVFINGKFFEVRGSGYEPKGEILLGQDIIDPLNHEELIFAGKMAAFCANAKTSFVEEGGYWRIVGDPTEAAMLVLAEKIGFKKMELEMESPLLAEIPFDYKNKYHATAHRHDGKELIIISGAPEKIISLSNREYFFGEGMALPGGEEFPRLTEEKKDYLESIFLEFSRKGKRVVAFAFAELSLKPKEEYVGAMIDLERAKDIVFGGFYAMEDSIRSEAIESIKAAERAGVSVVMITGDHRVTAEAIAREVGLFKNHDRIFTDEEIDRLSIPNLAKILGGTKIFARITPDHKMKIIKALKYRGDIVAMTGDGVNDAPSLVAADLGISMGKIGTEVAKEASDIVILDDNLGTIVAAIEEGRSVLRTLKKVILYLFSTSLGEVFVIAASIFLRLPLPVLPAQIIWLNLVTDSFLDVSLALEPKEDGLLNGGVNKRDRKLFDSSIFHRAGFMAGAMMVGTLGIFVYYLENFPEKALTVSMTTLAVFQWFNAWNCRSSTVSVFSRGFLRNRFLIAATGLVVGLQMLAVYAPPFQRILRTTPLGLRDWGLILLVSLSIVAVEEIRKIFVRLTK